MPTEASVSELARAHTEFNAARAQTPLDRSYRVEINRYKVWVIQQRQLHTIPNGPKFLTRSNVDLYFSTSIANRGEISAESARRAVCSLQKFADQTEYCGLEKFVIENEAVKRGLATQKHLCAQRIREQSIGKDPHDNLPTNMLTELEIDKVLRVAVGKRNYKDMLLCWTNCLQTFHRNTSMLILDLGHIKCNGTHGPNPGSIDDDNGGLGYGYQEKYMMSYILDKGLHKDRHTKKRVTGAWRHKNFLHCSTGNLAFNLMVRFFSANERQINFLHPPNEPEPMWWHIKLINEWSSTQSAYDAFEELLSEADLSWEKTTHLRKLGMEYGSSRGELETNKLSTMSKHKNGKGKVADYETELYRAVLMVMAGFLQGFYWMPRSRLFPFNLLRQHFNFPTEYACYVFLANHLFPQRPRWVQERESEFGDKSTAAANFLYETLPYLAMVIVQDGIYWIHDFPNHEITRLLLHAMPPWYPQWAAGARAECERMTLNRQDNQVNHLNDAAKAAFVSLQRNQEAFRAEIRRFEAVRAQESTARAQESAARAQESAARAQENELLRNELRLLREHLSQQGQGAQIMTTGIIGGGAPPPPLLPPPARLPPLGFF